MLWGKRLLRAAAVIAAAFAAGHAAETLKSPVFTETVSVKAGSPVLPAAPAAEAGAVPQSASLAAPGKAGLEDVTGIVSVAGSRPLDADACAPQLGLTAAPGAMIAVSLSAPCNRNERVVIRHSGLAFTLRTGPSGQLSQTLPALKTDAQVAVYLSGSRLVLGSVLVPDAAAYSRLALVWEPPTDLELRAVEGDKVLVGGVTPAGKDPARVMTFGTASLDMPVLASVFSAPGPGFGSASLTAELRITPATCGRTLRIVSLTASKGALATEERLVPVPLCGTSGDILVLKNLPAALKLATPK